MRWLLLLLLLLTACTDPLLIDEELPIDTVKAYHSAVPIILLPDSSISFNSAHIVHQGRLIPMVPEGDYLVGRLPNVDKEVSFTLQLTTGTTTVQIPHTIRLYHQNAPIVLYPHRDSLPIRMHYFSMLSKALQPMFNGSDTLQLDSTGTVTSTTTVDIGRWYEDEQIKLLLFWGDSLEDHLWAHENGYYRFSYNSRKSGPRVLRRIETYNLVPSVTLSVQSKTSQSMTINASYNNWYSENTQKLLYIDTSTTLVPATARVMDVTAINPIIIDSLNEDRHYTFQLIAFDTTGTEFGKSEIITDTTQNLVPPKATLTPTLITNRYVDLTVPESHSTDFMRYEISYVKGTVISEESTNWEKIIFTKSPQSTSVRIDSLKADTDYTFALYHIDKGGLYSVTLTEVQTKPQTFDAPQVTFNKLSDQTIQIEWTRHSGLDFSHYEIRYLNETGGEPTSETSLWESSNLDDTTATLSPIQFRKDIYRFSLLLHRSDGTSYHSEEYHTDSILIYSYDPDPKGVELSWKSLRFYTIQKLQRRSATSSNFKTVANLSLSVNSWTDKAVSKGYYFYRIVGIDGTDSTISPEFFVYNPY